MSRVEEIPLENLRSDGGPTDQTPMLLNTTAQSNLLAQACTGRAGQGKLSSIVLDGNDLGTSRRGTNVDHDDFVLGKLGDLGLLAVGCPYTEQTAQEVEVDFDLAVNLGKSALETKDETDQTIGTAQSRVNARTNTNETTRNGVLEVVGFGVEGNDPAEDGSAFKSTVVVTRDNTRADFDFVAEFDDTVQNGTTSNTTLEVINLSTRLVNIE